METRWQVRHLELDCNLVFGMILTFLVCSPDTNPGRGDGLY